VNIVNAELMVDGKAIHLVAQLDARHKIDRDFCLLTREVQQDSPDIDDNAVIEMVEAALDGQQVEGLTFAVKAAPRQGIGRLVLVAKLQGKFGR